MTDETAGHQPERYDKFHRELHDLKEELLKMARLAEMAIDSAITSALERDKKRARQVIAGDAAINEIEEAIDAHCVRLIALYQPVAIDLRQVMAVDHLIVELERIGDLAVNIAEETLTLENFPSEALHRDLSRMAKMVLDMVRKSLAAFLEHDAAQAREVCKADDEVDYLDRSIIQDLLGDMVDNEAIPVCQSQINIVRNLERTGDHATNIAEQVVYMVEGESVRHRCQG
jgi:phosphate transport system protein